MAQSLAIGLMSGTSMDGIDVAAVRTDGDGIISRGPSHFLPYEDALRSRVEQALQSAKQIRHREQRPDDLAALERDLTLLNAEAVRAFQARFPKWSAAEFIGYHGQTILHRPNQGLTVQLGDGALLARETGVTVVFDMRAADMQAGGQGAPLAPAYHSALARNLGVDLQARLPAVFVNIGGISNVTFASSTGDPVAFDSGPGNQLIDQWMQLKGNVAFDRDGAAAAQGRVDEHIVENYLQAPFFARSAPKSLDRSDFQLAGLEGLDLNDGARTLAAVAASAIHAARTQMPSTPKVWILCGGGRRNPHIVGDLRMLVQAEGSEVVTAEQAGFDGDATEAEAWAYLAVRCARALPITWPTTTGCRQPTRGGVLVHP